MFFKCFSDAFQFFRIFRFVSDFSVFLFFHTFFIFFRLCSQFRLAGPDFPREPGSPNRTAFLQCFSKSPKRGPRQERPEERPKRAREAKSDCIFTVFFEGVVKIEFSLPRGSKRAPREAKGGPRWSKTGPRPAKRATRGPREAQERPREETIIWPKI